MTVRHQGLPPFQVVSGDRLSVGAEAAPSVKLPSCRPMVPYTQDRELATPGRFAAVLHLWLVAPPATWPAAPLRARARQRRPGDRPSTHDLKTEAV